HARPLVPRGVPAAAHPGYLARAHGTGEVDVAGAARHELALVGDSPKRLDEVANACHRHSVAREARRRRSTPRICGGFCDRTAVEASTTQDSGALKRVRVTSHGRFEAEVLNCQRGKGEGGRARAPAATPRRAA